MVKRSSFKIIWDPEAVRQFSEILAYLAEQSNSAPGIVKKAIFHRLRFLKTNPLSCEADQLKDPPNEEFRAFVVFSYRITYQVKSDKKEVRVLRVRHASREPLSY